MDGFIRNLQYHMDGRDVPRWTMELEGIGDAPDFNSPRQNLDLFLAPHNVVVRCGHCGQWGARKCECKKCGAPIE